MTLRIDDVQLAVCIERERVPSMGETENTCRVRATVWATCCRERSSKRHMVPHAEQAEDTARHGSFGERGYPCKLLRTREPAHGKRTKVRIS